MPCFNAEKYIDTAIQSVLNQSFADWELLICDDGSTDKSISKAQFWAQRDVRVQCLTNQYPKGAAGARNTCIDASTGRYIAFLDADDEWLPMKLEIQIDFIRQSKASFIFSYVENINEQGNLISVSKSPNFVSLKKLYFSNFIPCLTVLYDTTIIGKVHQPLIKKRNDFALWLRILTLHPGITAVCHQSVVARYRINSYGLSSNKLSAINYFYRCLRTYANLSIINAVFCTIVAVKLKALKMINPRIYNWLVVKIF